MLFSPATILSDGNTFGMSVSGRNLFSSAILALIPWVISGVMLALFPLSAAADSASAILHSKGGVWVNGTEARDSTVVFPGDVLETKSGFVANLDSEGSSVLIQPQSLVKYQGTFLDLEHGGVAVGTSTSMSVHVHCIRVEPIVKDRTQYEVGDVNGTVHVAARKNDVNITHTGAARKTSSQDDATRSATVHEGKETSREESQVCGGADAPRGIGDSPSTKGLEITAGAIAGIGLLCVLLCSGGLSGSGSVSPSQP
jgi:hypothetical protein